VSGVDPEETVKWQQSDFRCLHAY